MGSRFREPSGLRSSGDPSRPARAFYVLVGYPDEHDELPTLYIGQADGVGSRIESHFQKKDFWDWGIFFVSTSGGLNRAHATWLEYALVERAGAAKRCCLDNGNAPQEASLTEAEKADTQGFLKKDTADPSDSRLACVRVREAGGNAKNYLRRR